MKIHNVDDVNQAVAAIASIGETDPESAHADEDGMYVTVLRLIADGHLDAIALAEAALQAGEIAFPRWYA